MKPDPPLRVEDRRFLAGAGLYVGDVRVEGCLDAAFVRAGVAPGRLRRADAAPALAVPGVVAAFAASDLPGLRPLPASEGTPDPPWPPLASREVRYAGEAVAVVVGVDRYAAEDGADAVAVEVEVEPRPGSFGARTFSFGEPAPEEVWTRAAAVVEGTYRSALVSASPLEGRALLVRPEPGGALTVWCSHQAAHRLRSLLAAALGRDEDAIRVIVPDVGGAFGTKQQLYPEYAVVAHVAELLGRPVRWIEDRREALTAAATGRGQDQRVRMAAGADGRILAIEAELDADVGAYPHIGEGIGANTAMMITGAYAIPHAHVRLRAVRTPAAPMTAYRGAGRPEAAYAVERTVDLLARKLELDPAELRRRNFVERFPYETAMGWTYDSGDYPRALDRALELAEVGRFREEQRARRAEPGSRPLGVGICCYVERSGGDAGGSEFGSVEALPDGGFLARSGSCASGQAHETTFAAVVGDALGVDPARVRVVAGDTAAVGAGVGTYGSRSLQVGGTVLHRAATALVQEARGRAAARFGVEPEDVAYEAGVLRAAGGRATLAELAAEAPLACEGSFRSPLAFPFGCWVAVVEVDPELGDVRVLRLVGVDDVGVVLEPAVVEGQVRGSLLQGLGQALYEGIVYDERGRAAETLLDYLLPTIAELPDEVILDRTETPNPSTPLGAKGAGEVGCIGVPPAVANAVADALQLDDPALLALPLTPERVWHALQRQGGAP